MSKMLQDDKTEHKTECFSVLIKSLTLKKTQAVAGPYCWQAAGSQTDLSPGKGNAAHTDQHFLGSHNNILARGLEQTNSFYFQTTSQKVENENTIQSLQ